MFEQGLCKQRYVPGQGCRPEGQLQVQSLCVRRALTRRIQERVGALRAVVSSEGGRVGAQGQAGGAGGEEKDEVLAAALGMW